MYNPEISRRKPRDPAHNEGGAAPGHEDDDGGNLSVRALASNPLQPLFERRAPVPARDFDARRIDPVEGRRAGSHLTLVEPGMPVVALDWRSRWTRVFHALEDDVIPRLVRYHALAHPRPPMKPSAAEFEDFFACLLQDDESGFIRSIDRMRERGLSVESVYMEVLVPAARRMGERWCDDTSDFVAVTVAVGHLHRLVQRLSADFCAEGHPTAVGCRILLVQPEEETHSLGLALVSEFFRRDGWDVVITLAGSGLEPAQRVQAEWFDAAGISTGTHLLLPGLRDRIAALRRQSVNPALVVMVGGPLFSADASLVAQVGADLTAPADEAPARVMNVMAARETGSRRAAPK